MQERIGTQSRQMRELAERLGARVSLHSVPDEGATFSVEVPLEFKGKQLEALMPEPRA